LYEPNGLFDKCTQFPEFWLAENLLLFYKSRSIEKKKKN
jgi:hypothetical protein